MLCLGGEESLVVLVGHDDFLAQHLAQFGHGLLVASLGPLAGIPGGSSIGHDGQCHGSGHCGFLVAHCEYPVMNKTDRKSTRLNSSHVRISYAVFCLKKKKNTS